MKRLLLWFAMGSLLAAQHLTEGAPHSRVRAIIYEDLQCSDCADFRNMLDTQLLPKYGSTVTFEHRDFPLPKHAWARLAAIAGRYFETINADLDVAWRRYCFQNMRAITTDNFKNRFAQFAKDNGQDENKALAALTDAKLAKQVEDDFQDGVARGIAHTPTVLVNGHPFIETFSFDEIGKTIDAELAAR